MKKEAKIKIDTKTMTKGIAKQGKNFFLFVLFFVLGAGLIAPAGFSRAKTITVDGDLTDWDDVSNLISRDIPDRGFTLYDPGNLYYYNTDTEQWQDTDPTGNSCAVNYLTSLDINLMKITNDNNYLYIYWQRGGDFPWYNWNMGPFPNRGASPIDQFSISRAAPSEKEGLTNGITYMVSCPCAGHIMTAPADFDHDMIISIDKDKDGKYDYYLVINAKFSKGAYCPAEGSCTNIAQMSGFIYEDNGNGTYDGKSSETLKSTLGNSSQGADSFYIMRGKKENDGEEQELKFSIDNIFADLGIQWDDSVNVRYEAHSDSNIATSEAQYKFEAGKKVKLKTSAAKKTKKSRITIKGTTVKGSTVAIRVNGSGQAMFEVKKKNGKFSKSIRVAKGRNTIRVESSNATKGSNNVTRTVVRK